MKGLLLVLCVALAGCASGPRFGEIEDSIPQPGAGMGRIFIYRSTSFGTLIQPTILLNGETVGEMVPLGFFYVDRSPGDYVVSTKTETEASVQVRLRAGDTRYVRASVGIGLAIGRPYLELVDDTFGKQEIRETSYVGNAALLGRPAASARPAKEQAGGQDSSLKDLEGLLPAGSKK